MERMHSNNPETERIRLAFAKERQEKHKLRDQLTEIAICILNNRIGDAKKIAGKHLSKQNKETDLFLRLCK